MYLFHTINMKMQRESKKIKINIRNLTGSKDKSLIYKYICDHNNLLLQEKIINIQQFI
jgi:hypothetical protein